MAPLFQNEWCGKGCGIQGGELCKKFNNDNSGQFVPPPPNYQH